MSVDERHQRGRDAEGLAAAFLATRGYRVVERNVRVGRGEIDIVAYDGEVLCFIEVRARTRTDFGGAVASVDGGKQRRLQKAAEGYLKRLSQPWPRCRFDVVGFTADDDVELVQGAFEVSA